MPATPSPVSWKSALRFPGILLAGEVVEELQFDRDVVGQILDLHRQPRDHDAVRRGKAEGALALLVSTGAAAQTGDGLSARAEASYERGTRALRQEVVHVPAPAGVDYDRIGMVTSDSDIGCYCRPELGNHILIGSEDPPCDDRQWVDPDDFDRNFTEQWRKRLGEVAGAESVTFRFSTGPGSDADIIAERNRLGDAFAAAFPRRADLVRVRDDHDVVPHDHPVRAI